MEAKVREATNNEPWGASSTVSLIRIGKTLQSTIVDIEWQ